MLLVAVICVGLGTWQIARLSTKHSANIELRRNDHAPVAAVSEVLPVYGTGPRPPTDDVQLRRVTAVGSYEKDGQVLVRRRSVGDDIGYLVLTPLRTSTGTLLVVRGFIAAPSSGNAVSAPAPPGGTVSITGRVLPAETSPDQAAQLPAGQVDSVNPADQAARLATTVYDGYVELLGGQPGTQGLISIPDPDLSNPAGGAVEPQHIAYIVQWFLFAALAIAAPLVMARAEHRRAPRELDDETPTSPADAQSARLADRYGRPVR
jgi:cytochrome oxidase assembly protein ShyY1